MTIPEIGAFFLMGSTESGLISRSRAGDRQAFTQLVNEHQGRIRAYIGTYLQWSDLVDDVAQDVFLDAFRALASYDDVSPFRLWLMGIARHRVLRHLRSDGRKRRSFEDLLYRRRMVRVEADEALLAERERQMEQLRTCLERLPPGSAEVVSEHYFRGTSLVEIARATGKKESAVRMMLLRVRQALKECLERNTVEGTA